MPESGFSSSDDHVDDVVLPIHGHAAEVRLVADFVVDIVELDQFRHDLADHLLLDGEQAAVLVERVHVIAADFSNAVHIVSVVLRTQLPLLFLVHGAEEVHLHHNSPLTGLRHKILQPLEVRFIPFRQIELVPAIGIARLVAPRPRTEEFFAIGCERVFGDVERPLRLDIGSAEGPRVVQTVSGELVEILDVVEVGIEDRAVVLARSDEDGRLAAEEEIVRIVGVEREGLGSGDSPAKNYECDACETICGRFPIAPHFAISFAFRFLNDRFVVGSCPWICKLPFSSRRPFRGFLSGLRVSVQSVT